MVKKILPYILGIFLLLGAFAHIFNPTFYDPFIPDFFPKMLANILAAISEAFIGLALVLPKYRKWGGLGFFLLMIAFLPIHVWDLFRENPAIGSKNAAVIRLIMQFLLIYAGWSVWKSNQEESPS